MDLKELIQAEAAKIEIAESENTGEPTEITDVKVEAKDETVIEEESKEAEVVAPDKNEEPKPEADADKKGTAQYKINTLVKQKKEAQEALEVERSEKASLLKRLEALEASATSKKDDVDDYLGGTDKTDAKYLTKEELGTILQDMFVSIDKTQKEQATKQEANTLNEDFAKLLEKEYGKFYDKDLDIIDEKANEELQAISELYNSNPKKWLEYAKKNGVVTLSKFVRGEAVDIEKVKAKQDRLLTTDETGSKAKVDATAKPETAKSAVQKAMALMKERE